MTQNDRNGMTVSSIPVFCENVTPLVDESRDVGVVYIDFSKAYDSISHHISLEELAVHGLDGCALCWIKNLAGWPGPENGGEWS